MKRRSASPQPFEALGPIFRNEDSGNIRTSSLYKPSGLFSSMKRRADSTHLFKALVQQPLKVFGS